MENDAKFDEIAEKIISRLKKKRVKLYEIYYRANRLLTILAEGGEVEDYRFSDNYGVSLRVIVDNRMGFSFSTNPDDDAIMRMVDDAIGGAVNSTPDENHAFASAIIELPETGRLFDEKIAKIPISNKVERAMSVEEGAISVDKRITRTRGAGYSEAMSEIFIRNGSGVDVGYKKGYVSAEAMAMAEDNGGQEMGWDSDFSITYDGIDPVLVGRRAGEMAISMLGAKKAPTGRFTALLTRRVVVELLEVLSSSFIGENVLKGKSMLVGKTNKEIFSPKLTIIDDGLLDNGIGTAPVDGEGVPKRRNELVKDGVLLGFLYDVLNANRAGKKPTGSSVRGGVTSPPASGVHNLFIVPGGKSPTELMEDIRDGLIITELMGVHTANPITGEFSVGASGFILEGGVKKHPFKEAAVSGDLIGLFSRIDEVGDDLRFFGGVGAPSLVVGGVELSGQ